MNKTLIFLLGLFLTLPVCASGYTTGKVVDNSTKKPVKWALVTVGNEVVFTDDNGVFNIKTPGDKVAVRAFGYLRTEQPVKSSSVLSSPTVISLVPFKPKALYLSVFGIGSKVLRGAALKLIEETELNSLVIDMKGDRGFVGYRSSVPLASEIGAQKTILVKDMKDMIRSLKEKGVYTIARIVVFKDDLLAQARPDLAIRTQGGAIWKDREGLAWVNPSSKEVWDYNIKLAIEAAQNGVDEIQFDYVRFPDKPGLTFAVQNTEENRTKAISDFLLEARKRLIPYNVFLSADIFGYVCWNLNDTLIGQKIEHVSRILDYMSPMLYPSGFQFGIPGYRNPVANSHEIVYLSLKKAQERTQVPPVRFRPWLQAFRDYAFDRRHYTGKEIREQISAAEKLGTNGWMLWNPRNSYSKEGLSKKQPG